MKITTSALKRIIIEAVRSHERYMSRADAEELIASMDSDAVARYDIIDEESGEIYVNAGDSFGESQLSPYHKPKPSKHIRSRFKPADDIDDDDESVTDMLAREESEARAAWEAALREYADNWRGWAYEHAEEYGLDDPGAAAQDSASDAADGFFSQNDDWRDWARKLRLSRSEMKAAVGDYVYDAMMEKTD